MEYHKLFITGVVRITADRPLADTAAELGKALRISFTEDPIGTCGDFPSFSAEAVGLSFVLLGIPELSEHVTEEPIVDYEFQVCPRIRTTDSEMDCDPSVHFACLICDRSTLILSTSHQTYHKTM